MRKRPALVSKIVSESPPKEPPSLVILVVDRTSSQFIHEVTHALEEVMALCDQVVILEVGRVLGQGRLEDWFEPDSEPE